MNNFYQLFWFNSPPVTVSNVNALKRQFPTCLKMHVTWPWRMSSNTAGSKAKLLVWSFFRRRLCIVKKRPLQIWRFFGLRVFSSAIRASKRGRSRSQIDMRLFDGASAERYKKQIRFNLIRVTCHFFECAFDRIMRPKIDSLWWKTMRRRKGDDEDENQYCDWRRQNLLSRSLFATEKYARWIRD